MEFWACILQVTGWIKEQSPPGQQIAELELSKLIQVVDTGQQKFAGSLESGHREKELGQVEESRG